VSSGASRWPTRASFGTGAYQALQRSADCAHLFTLVGQRDSPGQLIALDAATGVQVGPAFGSFSNNVQPTTALSLSADGGTLMLTASPYALGPYAAAFSVGGLLRGDGAPAQLWESRGPATGGAWRAPAQLASAQLSDGSVLLAYEPEPQPLAGGAAAQAAPSREGANASIALRRLRGADGSLLWEAQLPCAGGGNASISGLAVSEAAGLLLLSVEHPPLGGGELVVLRLNSGAAGAAGCLLPSAGPGLARRLRGLALDGSGGLPLTAWLLALDLAPLSYPRGGGDVTSAALLSASIDRQGACTLARSVGLTKDVGGLAEVPFLAPIGAEATQGLTSAVWPAVLLGPLANELAVVLPGVGVIAVK